MGARWAVHSGLQFYILKILVSLDKCHFAFGLKGLILLPFATVHVKCFRWVMSCKLIVHNKLSRYLTSGSSNKKMFSYSIQNIVVFMRGGQQKNLPD